MPVIDQNKATRWLTRIIESKGRRPGEICIVFCTDDYLLEINKQFLKRDYQTDIITFDYSKGLVVSGDLFISLDTVRENASSFQVDFNSELTRVICHGILHLLGYNDHTIEEKEYMSSLENFWLARF